MKSERIKHLEDIANGYFFQKDWDQYFYSKINLTNENLLENNTEEALKNINTIDVNEIDKKRIRNLFIETKIKCLIKSNQLQELKLWSKLFFDICVETKNFNKGLSYLELIDSKKIKSRFLNYYRLIFLIYKTDREAIEVTLETMSSELNVIDYLKKNKESYLYSKKIRSYLLRNLLSYGKEKDFLAHALEEILLDPDDFENIKKIINSKYTIESESSPLTLKIELQELDELEKNVKFLISAGKINEASEILLTAEKKYPFENRISKIKVILKMRSDFKIDNKNIASVETKKSRLNPNERDELYLKKWIELLDNQELLEIYDDLYVALYFLRFYSVNKFLVERLETLEVIKKDHFRYLNITYLKILNMFEMNEFYLVISETEMVLRGYKLSLEPTICFMYLLAEAYRKLKMANEAKFYYTKIAQLKNGYRLVNERLKEFNL